MQKLFDNVSALDERCYEEFGLSEDILMEHAAQGVADSIRARFPHTSSIIIIVGSGNNGADGIALARLLHREFPLSLYYAKAPKSKMAKLQAKRAHAIGVVETTELTKADIIVDAVVGSGFSGSFSLELERLFQEINRQDAYKIACDIPSGISHNQKPAEATFKADLTLSMGALKKSLFLDSAKEFVGEIEVLSLGVHREIYEGETTWHLLEWSDMKLPLRLKKDTHKGSYGHLSVISGEKSGASILSALAGLRFGAGLVTLVQTHTKNKLSLPYSLMSAHSLPSSTTAIALGMGLGYEVSLHTLEDILQHDAPFIVDADLFHMDILTTILDKEHLVITPHPKEFVALLKRCQLADIEIQTLQEKRFYYVELFCTKYPKVTLLLKGANVIIGRGKEFFINPYGTALLSKAGSGDVLSGLIGSLLAQGEEPLQATLTASLAHTKLAQNYTHSDFSLTAEDLISGIGNL